MGCYIDLPMKTSKAEQLIGLGAQRIDVPPSNLRALPDGKVLICVVKNPTFDAAGVAYNQAELDRMLGGIAGRDHMWLVLDRSIALELAPHIPNYEQEER